MAGHISHVHGKSLFVQGLSVHCGFFTVGCRQKDLQQQVTGCSRLHKFVLTNFSIAICVHLLEDVDHDLFIGGSRDVLSFHEGAQDVFQLGTIHHS